MKRMIFAAIAALAVAGCQPSTAPVEASNAPTPAASASAAPVAVAACEMTDTAMYAAEAAYNAPAAAYVSADAKGLLSSDVKAEVKPKLVDAYGWLKKARLFYSARDAVGFCGSTASLKSLAGAALALLPAN